MKEGILMSEPKFHIIDRAFEKSPDELEKSFMQKDLMTFKEAQQYAENFQDVQTYIMLDTFVDEHDFDGIAFTFKDGKAQKKVRARISIDGFGISQLAFIKFFEHQPIKMGKEVQKPYAFIFRPIESGDDIGGIHIYVETIYNECDWENELVLERLESEMLQPDEDDIY